MSELKCTSCGKKAVFVTTKGKLEKVTDEPINLTCGLLIITPEIFEKLIDLFKTIFNKVFGWFEENNQKYVVCKSCGYYERLDG